MNAPVKGHRPATYQDVIDAPPHLIAEIVRGVLYLSRRLEPRLAHARTALGLELSQALDRRRGDWWIFNGPEVHIGGDVLVPDIGGWRRERMPVLRDDWFGVPAPDWACEVLGPDTRALDLTDKRAIYGEAGVGHLWLVDPPARMLEVFALKGGRWVLIASLKDDEEIRVPPFGALAFALDALWAD
jgi:Uma2 family endonuclease